MALPDVRLRLKTLLIREALRIFDERVREVHPNARTRIEADASRSVANFPDETLRRVFHACLSIAAVALFRGEVTSTVEPIVEVPLARDRQDPRGV